ncbi:uncharacterized protein LOC122498616 [Leptopilina heterotoma]|uniref:uncharacterized protein LOC122498616 n=1 Tax=Leptopilina heterotoma TaxID=63436 RepID=UPI001CA82F6F|nr:uncharacterized protein LOC122498616 [Leptopilina heterotoma]
MDNHFFTQVKIHMKSQYFTFNESWLKECVQYCVKTHPKISIEGIQSFAIEQWLLADLREINNENGCLPKNLIEKKSTILNGCYILQMEKMYDISTSKYKQLNKIRDVNVENLKATKEDKSEIPEIKNKRMYELFLSDGLQEIKAIEYKTIDLFNNILLPGNKVKLIGPITCRRGIILLEKRNIAILGGEVEDLLIENSVENIMARFLNLGENPDPYNDEKKGKECEKMEVEEEYLDDLVNLVRSQDSENKILNPLRNNSIVNYQPDYGLNREKNPINNDEMNECDIELEALLNDPDIVHEFPSSSIQFQISPDNLKIPNDFQKVNQTFNLENLSNNRQSKNDDSTTVKLYQNTSKTSNLSNNCQCKNYVSATEEIFQSSEFNEISRNFEKNSAKNNEVKFTETWSNFEYPKNDEVKFTETLRDFEYPKNNELKFTESSTISDDLILNDDDVIIIDDDDDDDLNKGDNSQHFASNFPPNNEMNMDFDLKIRKLMNENLNTSLDNSNNKYHEMDFNETLPDLSKKKTQTNSIESDKFKVSPKKTEIFQQLSPIKSNTIRRPKSLGFKALKTKISTDSEDKLTSKPFKPLFPKSKITKGTNSELFSTEKIHAKIDLTLSPKDGAEKLSNYNFDTELKKLSSDTENSPTATKRLASDDPILNSHQNKTPRVSKSVETCETEEKLEIRDRKVFPKNCDVICDLIVMTLTDQVIYKTVKAQVKEIDKLTNKGDVWKLNGIITDGTATLEVDFASQFMEKILGMSSLKFAALKKQARNNSEIELKLKYTLRNGQEKLMITDWLMHVGLTKNKLPSVEEGFELSESEKENFQKRLKILKSRQI